MKRIDLIFLHAVTCLALIGTCMPLIYGTTSEAPKWVAFSLGICLIFLISLAVFVGVGWVWERLVPPMAGIWMIGYIGPLIIVSVGILYASLYELDPAHFIDHSNVGRLGPYLLTVDILTLCGVGMVIPAGKLASTILALNQIFAWIFGGLLINAIIRLFLR